MAFTSFSPNTQIKSSEINANFTAIANGSEVANTAWTSWTPTLAGGFTDSKWNKTCRYIRIGKTVIARFRIIANTTTPLSAGGDPTFTLPVTASALIGSANIEMLGRFLLYDAASAINYANVTLSTTSTALLRTEGSAGTYVNFVGITSTIPFTWTTNYEIAGTFVYEAA